MACDVILELIVELEISRKPVHPRLKPLFPSKQKHSGYVPISILICFLPKSLVKTLEIVSPILADVHLLTNQPKPRDVTTNQKPPRQTRTQSHGGRERQRKNCVHSKV